MQVKYESQVLFYVERPSINKNSAYYSVVWNKLTGELHPTNPITVHWVMWEKDATGNTTESLTRLEEAYVYGIRLEVQNTTPPRQTFHIVSMSGNPITVFFSPTHQVWKAGMTFQFPLSLHHISATIKNRIGIVPTVTDLVVHGFNNRGEEVSRVITVNRSLLLV